MINYASSLKKVCSGLNEKSMGKPYSHAEYMADIKKIDVFKDSCSQAQAKLFQQELNMGFFTKFKPLSSWTVEELLEEEEEQS